VTDFKDKISSDGTTLPIITSQLLSSPSLRFGISTRLGGVSPAPLGMNLSFRVGDDESNVIKNRSRFFGALDIPQDRVASPRQVHGGVVKAADKPGEYAECDALVTNAAGLYLSISVADCVPIALCDVKKGIVGLAHAGWRGTAKGIVQNTILKIEEEFGGNPENLAAYVGPSAGVCCYGVGEDVARVFPSAFVILRNGHRFVDLKSANVDQLKKSGVPADRIEVSPHCTISDAHLFHSFRRDGTASGRMMAVIGMTA
jgi:YfiH family protein